MCTEKIVRDFYGSLCNKNIPPTPLTPLHAMHELAGIVLAFGN
jgi:hypothetical protein